MISLFLQEQLTGTASFTPTDDSTYEGNETGVVAISGVSVQMLQKMELSQSLLQLQKMKVHQP